MDTYVIYTFHTDHLIYIIDEICYAAYMFMYYARRFFIVYYLLFAVFVCYAEPHTWHYAARVTATSDGKQKIIYAELDGQQVENKMLLTVTKQANGDISIESPSFKLGNMPFSASFTCTIAQKEMRTQENGSYTIQHVKGVYKVLFSKYDAFIDGTFDEAHCALTLTVQAKKKNLIMVFSYPAAPAHN